MRFLSTIFILPAALITIHLPAAAQSEAAHAGKPELTVEKIMRDPKWIGESPDWISWSEDSKSIYFWWNPENA
ncbi:MAG: hypothetical protein JSU65_00175, partial [Candidatus Zixiibacteriota bacterium]